MHASNPPSRDLRIVGTSHAFIGGKLNLAHAAAIYLPADVMTRLGAHFGRPALLATGLDVHGRRASRALRAGGDATELADQEERSFRASLAQLHVNPDIFIRTDDPELIEIAGEALERLDARNLLKRRASTTFHCARCGDDLSAMDMRRRTNGAFFKSHAEATDAAGDQVCAACQGDVERRETEQIAFVLNRPAALAALLSRQPGKVARKLLASLQTSDFLEWEITRDNYHGLPASIDPSKSLYVWFPALLSKALLAKAVGATPREFFASDRATFFFGKNIVPYYGLVLPALLQGWLDVEFYGFQFCVRGFCDLQRSQSLLDIEQAVAKYDVDTLRFFCLYSAPDDAVDFVLEPERLITIAESVMEKGFGRYLTAALSRLHASAHPDDALPRPQQWAQFDRLHQQGDIRRLLLELEQFARNETKTLATQDVANVCSGYRAVYDILSAYVPRWIQRFSYPRSAP